MLDYTKRYFMKAGGTLEAITNIILPERLREHFGENSMRAVRKGSPFKVGSFSELIRMTAEVSCRNPSIMTLYRGQRSDWRSNRGSMLLPSLFRWSGEKEPSQAEIYARTNRLRKMASALLKAVDEAIKNGEIDEASVNHRQLSRRHGLVWAVLQHYGYCPTPYLDVTQSLRMACMFALDGAREQDRPCVYVLGFPFVYDKFFRDSNAELSVTRLLSAMPPVAKRAYYQEGYLVGSELDLTQYTPKHDVSQRLLAKFELTGNRDDWIRELSTFARQDVYSEDFFSQIRPQVIKKVDSSNEQPCIDLPAQPERFPSLG